MPNYKYKEVAKCKGMIRNWKRKFASLFDSTYVAGGSKRPRRTDNVDKLRRQSGDYGESDGENRKYHHSPNHSPGLRQTSSSSKAISILGTSNDETGYLCSQYAITGYCKGKDKGICPFEHDPEKRSICRRFMCDRCINPECGLLHCWDANKVPDCPSLIELGSCRDGVLCRYRHLSSIHDGMFKLCRDFSQGFCKKGRSCPLVHAYVCRNFKRNGKCPYKAKCFFIHIEENFGNDRTGDYRNNHTHRVKVEPEEEVDSRWKNFDKRERRYSKSGGDDHDCNAFAYSNTHRRENVRLAEETTKNFLKGSPPSSLASGTSSSKATNLKRASLMQKGDDNNKNISSSNNNNKGDSKGVDASTSVKIPAPRIKLNPRPPDILSMWTDEPTEVKIEYDEGAELPIVREIVHDGWTSTFYTRTINEYDLV